MRIPVPEESCDLRPGNRPGGRGHVVVNSVRRLSQAIGGFDSPNTTSGGHTGGDTFTFFVTIAPSGLQQTTKTGKSDDSVLLGDLAHNSWLKQCLFELRWPPTLPLHLPEQLRDVVQVCVPQTWVRVQPCDASHRPSRGSLKRPLPWQAEPRGDPEKGTMGSHELCKAIRDARAPSGAMATLCERPPPRIGFSISKVSSGPAFSRATWRTSQNVNGNGTACFSGPLTDWRLPLLQRPRLAICFMTNGHSRPQSPVKMTWCV